jgi:hypothetical protein
MRGPGRADEKIRDGCANSRFFTHNHLSQLENVKPFFVPALNNSDLCFDHYSQGDHPLPLHLLQLSLMVCWWWVQFNGS